MLKPKYHVYDSAILDAPLAEVWDVVRDITAILPIVFGESFKDYGWVDGGSVDRIPSRFRLTLQGEEALEEVVGRSETEHSLTYRSIGRVLSIEDYIATYSLKPITGEPGKTFFQWPREFSLVEGADPSFASFIADLTAKEVAALRAHFAKRGDKPAA